MFYIKKFEDYDNELYDYSYINDNDITDDEMFLLSKSLGEKIILDPKIIKKVKEYTKSCYDLNNNDIRLSFYKPENVIISIITDNTFKKIGKTGKTVNMSKANFIIVEESQYNNDKGAWIEHEVGHVISWKKYKDRPRFKSKFLTGGENNPFDIKSCYGNYIYPNAWNELIPNIRQMKHLLNKNYTPEEIIRLIMVDYEDSRGKEYKILRQYEQVFINYINFVTNCDNKLVNFYENLGKNKK